VHGCAGLTEGSEESPHCWRGSDSPPLVLWLAGEPPGGSLTVLVDDVPADGVEIDADGEGVRIVAQPPPSAGRVVVEDADGRRFSLVLVPEPPAWVAARRELDERLEAGRSLHEVRARLSQLRAGLGPVEQHRLDCFAAKLAFAARDVSFARDT